jgi:hypothetical protein
MRRQARGKMGPQCARFRIGAGARHHIGDQPSFRRAGQHRRGHRRLGDVGVQQQTGFDLAGLDAKAADLDLLVEAAEEFHRAILAQARAIAGAIHARS